MSEIRATYSGLISLFVGFGTIIASTIFMVIVTRNLSTFDFGTWSLINNLLIYGLYLEPIVSFWIIRETARNFASGKTAIIVSSLFSLIGISIYFIISFFVGNITDVNNEIVYFAIIIVPVSFLNKTLLGIITGWRPHVANYGLLVFGICQIIFAFVFLIILDYNLEGLILGMFISYAVTDIILSIYCREKLKVSFSKDAVIKWLKLPWISLYPSSVAIIQVLDILVFSIITGSVLGLSFWQASLVIASMVVSSGLLTYAIYPKLLQSNETNFVTNNLTYTFYFAIPITSIAIVFAKPGLFILNPEYLIAFPIAVILSITMFFRTFGSIFSTYITGVEKVDVLRNSKFKNYLHSKLFFIPSLSLIHYLSYVPILAFTLFLFKDSVSLINLVLIWSIVALITQIPWTIYFYFLAKKNLEFKLEVKNILKYLLISTIVFGIIYLFIERSLNYSNDFFSFLSHVLLIFIISAFAYFLSSYILDSKIRQLTKSILNEFKN